MRHQLVAVIHHSTFETLAVEAETAHQRVDGYQHRPCDVVGIDLVAGHQQHGRARPRIAQRIVQQLIHAQQAIRGGVVRFAAGAVQHAVEPRLDDETRRCCFAVEQMRCPVGDALLR